jgi:hypothetical protein
VPTPQDFISLSLHKYYHLFLQVIVVVVIDSIIRKDTCVLSLVEGIDQTNLTLYSIKHLLTSTNPSLA